jgi:Zn-dependent peptidase ImmA (M78 family)
MSIGELSFAKAEEWAEKLIRENCLTEFPIIAESVAEKYGISVVHYIFSDEYKNVASLFLKSEKEIYINDLESMYKKNFITAHELGHIFLNHTTQENYSVLYRDCPISPDDQSDMDREANHFAMCLLIPIQSILQITLLRPRITTELLSKIYGVPVDVMRFRRQELGL